MKLSYILFRLVKWLIFVFYPKIRVDGAENLLDSGCMVIANHAQMHGPIACELYFPGKHYTWCAGEMMHLKDVPAYAYKDFWSNKPKYSRWFYKILSYIIAPLSVCIFNNAETIGVYHDSRSTSTFKATIRALQEGASVVIFPEHAVEHNHIVNDFQQGFVDIARFYCRRTGKPMSFVPMYIAPDLKAMYLGKPIEFFTDTPIEAERERICNYLMEEITRIAEDLPGHTVVPYLNLPKKLYPSNKVKEEKANEDSGS